MEARDGGHGSGWNIAGVLSDSIEIQQFGLAAPQSDSAWVTAGRLNPAPGSRVRLSPLCIFAPVRDRDPKDHNLLMIFR